VTWLREIVLHSARGGLVSILVNGLAWPLAVVAVAAIFRSEVRRLVDRLTRVKYRDFEAKFRRELRQTEDAAAQTGIPHRLLERAESRTIVHQLDFPREAHLGTNLPNGRQLITDAWAEVIAATKRRQITAGDDAAASLVLSNTLTGLNVVLFERLRQLRADLELLDDYEPSREESEGFARLARLVALRISLAPDRTLASEKMPPAGNNPALPG
jgi:hypothetical protein